MFTPEQKRHLTKRLLFNLVYQNGESMQAYLNKLKDFVTLARPGAWPVTLFTLSAGAVMAFFMRGNFSYATIQQFIILCMGFTAIASGLYVLNDINDADFDRKNPFKDSRPIASGRVNKKEAFVLCLFLISTGLFLTLQISYLHLLLGFILIALQIVYSTPPVRLKESKFDFLFCGPLNHMIRFGAAWALFKPLTEMPQILMLSLFLLYTAAYINYKLLDNEFIPKQSIAKKPCVFKVLNLSAVTGLFLFSISCLIGEIPYFLIICPIFLGLISALHIIVPKQTKIKTMRKITYFYTPHILMLGMVALWSLVLVF